MPRGTSVHFGTSTTPNHTSNAVNEVVAAISRKLSITHTENNAITLNASPRRSSFSMDSILHPHKDKKRNDSRDRVVRERPVSSSLRPTKNKTSSASASPKLSAARAGKFEVVVESGPLVLYGIPANSTGAILGGRLKLLIEDPTGEVTINKLTLAFRTAIQTKKPIVKDCGDCKQRYEDLHREALISEPRTFYRGKDNQFPFSHLFPGDLPASTSTALGSISYQLVATALTAHGDIIEIVHPLLIQRAIAPGPDKASIRIFPPTNLNARITLPPVIHPMGKFPVQLILTGVVEKKSDVTTRWRLRKVLWHLEEVTTMLPRPCQKHADKAKEGKANEHTDTKVVGISELKNGWKSDFDTAGGEIQFEFEAALSTKPTNKAACGVSSPAGLRVLHTLIVELIIAEEFVSKRNPSIITPTGSARVLRMSFVVVVSERAGMNISWDEEMPPMYEDVPDSPPHYGNADSRLAVNHEAIMTDYAGPALEYEELERMRSDDPNEPPRYRERDPEDRNEGLPMRPANPAPATAQSTAQVQAGPSSTRRPRSGWTANELEEEPPQYAIRRRESSQAGSTEDIGEGTTGTTA